MKYLLDTNIISEPLRLKPSNSVMRQLRRHEDDIAIPAPVWHELRFGCARLGPSRQREAIERYIEDVVLASFPVLEYDQRAADWHAIERARLSAAGKTPPFIDGQIAAIAFVHNLTLVTLNMSDFQPFKGLRIRSWA